MSVEPDAGEPRQREGACLVVSDEAGLPISGARWSAAKGGDVRAWGTTDSAGRAEIHCADPIPAYLYVSVRTDGYYPAATNARMKGTAQETVASVVMKAEPPLLILSDDGSPITDYSVEFPVGKPVPQRYGAYTLAQVEAVLHARGHISLPLAQLPADIECGLEPHTAKTSLYLLRSESLDRLRLVPVGVDGTVYARIAMRPGAAGVPDVGDIAKRSQHLPPEWKAFYSAPFVLKDLSRGSSQFFVGSGESGLIAFSGREGAVIFGAGRGNLSCWAEDRERFDYERESEAPGEQVVSFAMSSREWIRKRVTISDAYGRASPGPVGGRLTRPFHRELSGLVTGDNTIVLPPDETAYSIVLFTADLGVAQVAFGPDEAARDVDVTFSGKELRLRFADEPHAETLKIRSGGAVRWDSESGRFVLSGVATQTRSITVETGDRKEYEIELPPDWAAGEGPIAEVVVTLASGRETRRSRLRGGRGR